ncbi:uncharacterized protein PV07_06842 [Cladophialophora immunda]|uniref:Protein-lysine N-methyltransferase EFM4 n=1 Tax=Cladophialophora immunda TaxID=569365 RepID=A0A0D2C7G8_9EURO|nr:uncharacterized protein PV07_06842 [Cladophialophora immunda]KIW27063.1 hypothetical protein PV07_06842 [Cladophialophora immunda]
MADEKSHPVHLEPSELGTKEYWDEYYQNDLENGVGSEDENGAEQDAGAGDEDEDDHATESQQQPPDPSELDSWFDDVGAPAKTLAFLTSTTFPLSPNYIAPTGSKEGDRDPADPSVLDLGTGNGSALFALRLQGHYTGRMVGVDYSTKSVELARKLRAQYAASTTATATATATDSNMENITFEVLDIIHDPPGSQPWWPPLGPRGGHGGFDLVLDKGTFDAISLSSSTVFDRASTRQRRICELYPAKVLEMVKTGGFLLVTSCNWTEAEVIAWFTSPGGGGSSESADVASSEGTGIPEDGCERAVFEVYDTIKYPVFEFAGQKGQGVASVCFRKLHRNMTDQG